jgi:hypothetical protein
MNDNEIALAAEKAGLLDELYMSPATKNQLLGMVKQVRPSLPLPEYDNTHNPEFVQMKAEVTRMKLKEQYGMSDSEFQETVKTMATDKIQSFDAAVELNRHRAAAAPRNTQHTSFALPDTKDLFSNPAGWARREAQKAVEEFRLNRSRNQY